MNTFEANGARFIAENDMIVSWCRKTGKPFEPETTAFMFDVMAKRGGQFVDVGASTGWFSVPMAAQGFDVYAIEPNPRPAARLQENATLNDAFLVIHRAAASDMVGEAVLHFNAGLPLTSGASLNLEDCLAPTGRETVRTVMLDSLGLDDVSLVKIDVEGHELPVLRGAADLVGECRPHLVLEANTDAAREELSAWLDENGYEWMPADERNMLCSPRP